MASIRIAIPGDMSLNEKPGTSMRVGAGAPPVNNGFFGSKNILGGGNWGTSANRAMGNTYPLANTATLKIGYLYILTGSGSASVKLCVYSDVAGVAGNRIAVSSPTLVNGQNQYFAFNFNNEVLSPGSYHLMAVSDAPTGAGYDMGSADSGGTPAAKIYNGTFSYAVPPASAPAPDASYNNGLAIYVDYTY